MSAKPTDPTPNGEGDPIGQPAGTQAAPGLLRCTVFTSEQPTVLTKVLSLDDSGAINKSSSAHMVKGTATVVTMDNMVDFAELLGSLQVNHALTYGIPKKGATQARVVTTKELAANPNQPNTIARSIECMEWPAGPGVLMLDYDAPADGGQPLSREQLVETLKAVLPELFRADWVFWFSSSSLIYNEQTGEMLQGVRGQRLYIPVANATDIERVGKVLTGRLWLSGYGRFEISKAGSLLPRTLVDANVWQVNRFDFAAGAKCVPPLVQRRGAPQVIPGTVEGETFIDTKSLILDPDMMLEMQIRGAQEKAAAEMRPQVEKVQADYVQQQVVTLKGKHPDKDESELRTIVRRATEHKCLMGDFEVPLADGRLVTVAELLDNREKYHRAKTFDPLEPEYDGRRVVGILFLDSLRPILWSQAHGGRGFRLERTPFRVEVVEGKTAHLANQIIDRFAKTKDVFDYGGLLATVDGGKLHVFGEASLTNYLGMTAQFYKLAKVPNSDKYTERDTDPPVKMVQQLLKLPNFGLGKITGVINAPTMRPDYSIVSRHGYDEATQLYFSATGDMPYIPLTPTIEQTWDAMKMLWAPFEEFPFETPKDKGVMLAALLTAAVRPGLRTAPAFAFDAPVQGSGKTLLAACVACLAGEEYAVMPPISGRDGEEEIRKRITSVLLQGKRAVIWDNMVGTFDSATMGALLTFPTFSDRVLGRSEMANMPSKLMVLFTGNNVALAGDMPRRILICRINPQHERVYDRKFSFDPLAYCNANRTNMIAAALTFIRGWYANRTQCGTHGRGRLASFEGWDSLVREPVAWIGRVTDEWCVDPIESIDENIANDPKTNDLVQLLLALYAAFGETEFSGRDVANINLSGKPIAVVSDVLSALAAFPLSSASSSTSVGNLLKYKKDVIVGGYVLRCRHDKTANQAKWRVALHKK
jgi:hypothetical protein